MRLLAITTALLALAGAAHAQSNWTSQRLGNQTYYNGTTSNGGSWNGTSTTLGNQTYSNFHGSNGQTTNCTQQRIGSQVYTNCN